MAQFAVKLIEVKYQRLAERIQAAHDRLAKGDAEWIEGTLDLAVALASGREMVPANIAFRDWLKQHGLNFYGHNERAALLDMASNPALARTILQSTNSRSYQLIGREFMKQAKELDRLTNSSKTTARKPRDGNHSRAMLIRRAKLGEELSDKIKDTSLGSVAEMNELIMLNRGAAAGEHTDIVKQLVAQAMAGEPVSARAYSTEIAATGYKPKNLLAAWKKRMVFVWKQATKVEQEQLIDFLMDQIKTETPK